MYYGYLLQQTSSETETNHVPSTQFHAKIKYNYAGPQSITFNFRAGNSSSITDIPTFSMVAMVVAMDTAIAETKYG